MAVEMKLKVIGIIAIVLVSVIALGCVESQPSQPTSVETPKPTVVYTQVSTPKPTETQPSKGIIISYLSDTWPEPRILSEKDKASYPHIEIRNLMKSPDTYSYNNIFLRGEVSWIQEEYGLTHFIINVPGPDSPYVDESLIVNYKGKLPRIYKGTAIKVYGIVKGTGTVTNAFGAEREVPTIYAVQVSDANTPETSTSTLKLVADKKILTKGETWDIGSGYSLKVQSIEQKTIPKQVWLVLSINGNKLEDRVSPEGETYTYKNIFSTKIESVSDTEVVLKDTYISP